jgi:hypothetical protein
VSVEQGWEKAREIRKNWFFTGKMRKTGKIAFFKNTCLKRMLNYCK